jgi:hypothetical protein
MVISYRANVLFNIKNVRSVVNAGDANIPVDCACFSSICQFGVVAGKDMAGVPFKMHFSIQT